MQDNIFSYNGLLKSKTLTRSKDTYDRQYPRSEFPWDDYEFDEAQQNGMFTFTFDKIEMPIGTAHIFRRNKFMHLYCQIGCAYNVKGSQIQ